MRGEEKDLPILKHFFTRHVLLLQSLLDEQRYNATQTVVEGTI